MDPIGDSADVGSKTELYLKVNIYTYTGRKKCHASSNFRSTWCPLLLESPRRYVFEAYPVLLSITSVKGNAPLAP